MSKTALILVHNTRSGAFQRGLTLEDLRESLHAAGWVIDTELDLSSETDELEQLDVPADSVVAIAGGDGTIMSVLNSLAQKQIEQPVLVLPCGTANLLARQLHRDLDLDAVLDRGRKGQTRSLKLGSANDQIFAVAAAIGFSPAAVQVREEVREKGVFGRFRRYARLARAGLHSVFTRSMRVQLDDAPAIKARAIYAQCPKPDAARDGLQLTGGNARNVAELAAGLAEFAGGNQEASGALWSQSAHRVRVTSRRRIPVILDGEPQWMTSPVSLEFGQHSLNVIVT
ncbi:diacylglycerol/lipid kinase family protein [Hyphobacterium sp.]|uniref:diacylglycerol/lipid kinase family protein n=1 Tax=Hyphobacterium sp. TaxID=2004662 RepID=UPI003BA89E2A